MITSYTPELLDTLLRACIDFDDKTDLNESYEGNISGRQGLKVALDGSIKRMMKCVSKLDIDVLEDLGRDTENIEYFRLGANCRNFLENGGFVKYFEELKRKKLKDELLLWIPILAILISVMTWLFPKNDDDKLKALEIQVSALKMKQEQMEAKINTSQVGKVP